MGKRVLKATDRRRNIRKKHTRVEKVPSASAQSAGPLAVFNDRREATSTAEGKRLY
jgi:hypothetical protein